MWLRTFLLKYDSGFRVSISSLPLFYVIQSSLLRSSKFSLVTSRSSRSHIFCSVLVVLSYLILQLFHYCFYNVNCFGSCSYFFIAYMVPQTYTGIYWYAPCATCLRHPTTFSSLLRNQEFDQLVAHGRVFLFSQSPVFKMPILFLNI